MAKSYIWRHCAVFAVIVTLWFVGLGAIEHSTRIIHEQRKELLRRAVIVAEVAKALPRSGDARARFVEGTAVRSRGPTQLAVQPLVAHGGIEEEEQEEEEEEDYSAVLRLLNDDDNGPAWTAIAGINNGTAVTLRVSSAHHDHRSCRLLLVCWGLVAAAVSAGLFCAGTQLGCLVAIQRRLAGSLLVAFMQLASIGVAAGFMHGYLGAERGCYNWGRAALMRETAVLVTDALETAVALGASRGGLVFALTQAAGALGSGIALVVRPGSDVMATLHPPLHAVVVDAGEAALGVAPPGATVIGTSNHVQGIDQHFAYYATLSRDENSHPSESHVFGLVLGGIAATTLISLILFPFPIAGKSDPSSSLDQMPRTFGVAKLVQVSLIVMSVVATSCVTSMEARREHQLALALAEAHRGAAGVQQRVHDASRRRLQITDGVVAGTEWEAAVADFSDVADVLDVPAAQAVVALLDEARTVRMRVAPEAAAMVRAAASPFFPSTNNGGAIDGGGHVAHVGSSLDRLAALDITVTAHLAASILALDFAFTAVEVDRNISLFQKLCDAALSSLNVQVDRLQHKVALEASPERRASFDLALDAVRGISAAAVAQRSLVEDAITAANARGALTLTIDDFLAFFRTAAMEQALLTDIELVKNITQAAAATAGAALREHDRHEAQGYKHHITTNAATVAYVAACCGVALFLLDTFVSAAIHTPQLRYSTQRVKASVAVTSVQLFEAARYLAAGAVLILALCVVSTSVTRGQRLADIETQRARLSEVRVNLEASSAVRIAGLSMALSTAISGCVALAPTAQLLQGAAAVAAEALEYTRGASLLLNTISDRQIGPAQFASFQADIHKAAALQQELLAAASARSFVPSNVTLIVPAAVGSLGHAVLRQLELNSTDCASERTIHLLDAARHAIFLVTRGSEQQTAVQKSRTWMSGIEPRNCTSSHATALETLVEEVAALTAAARIAERHPPLNRLAQAVTAAGSLASTQVWDSVGAVERRLLPRRVHQTNAQLALFWVPAIAAWLIAPIALWIVTESCRMVGIARHSW